MTSVLLYMLMALAMVVPVFVGLRLLLLDAARMQEWTGFRVRLRTCRRMRWVVQLVGIFLIGAGIFFGYYYVF